jgi:nucleoid-associated protein YgaU
MNKLLRFGLVPIALALAGLLRAADDAASAPPAEDMASVKADNKQLTDELAASWKETASLKADLAAAQAAASKNADANSDLQKQLSAAQTPRPDAAPAADPGQVADLQEKLATALRSFTVIQDEEAQLRASLDKATSDNASLTQQLEAFRSANASLQEQAASTAVIEPLRTELRQAQDEVSRLASENAQLRTHLALQAPSPGSASPVPMRPGQAPAMTAAAPAPAPTPAPAKTYVVAEGDTLTKISRKFYGNSGRWQDILNANHDVLKDEKSLVVGSTLKIP